MQGPADILTLEDKEIEMLKKVKVYAAGTHLEFLCYYMKTHDINGVEAGIANLKIKHGDATHVVTAYRFEGAKAPLKQGYNDDEEGAGCTILKALKAKDVQSL